MFKIVKYSDGEVTMINPNQIIRADLQPSLNAWKIVFVDGSELGTMGFDNSQDAIDWYYNNIGSLDDII